MTLDELHAVLAALGAVERAERSWRLTAEGETITCLADPVRDELRLVLPVAELAGASERDKERFLEASFSATLEARLAAFEGVVVAVWGGRLSSADERAIGDAVAQVLMLGGIASADEPA